MLRTGDKSKLKCCCVRNASGCFTNRIKDRWTEAKNARKQVKTLFAEKHAISKRIKEVESNLLAVQFRKNFHKKRAEDFQKELKALSAPLPAENPLVFHHLRSRQTPVDINLDRLFIIGFSSPVDRFFIIFGAQSPNACGQHRNFECPAVYYENLSFLNFPGFDAAHARLASAWADGELTDPTRQKWVQYIAEHNITPSIIEKKDGPVRFESGASAEPPARQAGRGRRQ